MDSARAAIANSDSPYRLASAATLKGVNFRPALGGQLTGGLDKPKYTRREVV